jgi:hypothetical protein
MGIGLRIFFINEDESLQPLAMAKYNRLLRRDPKECLTRYAGKRVRYALVVVDLADRKPVEILQIQYAILKFDSEGRIDVNEQEREWLLAVEVLPPYTDAQPSSQVIDARHHFAKKRYDNEYKWVPSPEIEAAIRKAIFDKNQR